MKNSMDVRSNKYKRSSQICAMAGLLATLAVSHANAALTGPVYPAPGGNSFASNLVAFRNTGDAAARAGTYTGFTPSAYGQLYFGESNNQSICISLDNTNSCSGSEYQTTASSFFSGSNTYSTGGNGWLLHGSASYLNGFTNSWAVADTYTYIALFDSLNNGINWVTGTSVGLPGVDFVADVTAAAASGGFHYESRMFVCDNVGCGDPASVYARDHMDSSGGNLFTSVGTGFFASPAQANGDVPEPNAFFLAGVGLAAIGLARRRKN